MAITAYTGTPGAGKTYALVSRVIIPALAAGRTVRANIAGLDVEKCEAMANQIGPGGGVLLPFDSKEMLVPGFFPTEARPTGARVSPGDLLVIDELRLTFPNRGTCPARDFEPFLRYHRHMVSEDGVACDVVFGTQLITDVHRDYRGLIERSYKFKKLSAVGLKSAYVYLVFEGSEQKKGTEYSKGNGKFEAKYFELYKSYETDGDATEVQADSRSSLYSRTFVVVGAGALAAMAVGGYFLWRFLSPPSASPGEQQAVSAPQPRPAPSAPPVSSQYRIVGFVENQSFPVVLLSDGENVYTASAGEFAFRNGRPISGYFRGQRVEASDLLAPPSPSSQQAPTSLLPQF